MDKLAELFPDTVVRINEYQSFINQPERIQVTSQQDINDYDPTTLTSFYNFRVRLPRPALNVKSLQLARVNIPNAVPSFPDTECTFWYYALPTVSAGNIFLNNQGAPGAIAYTFDTSGNIYSGGELVAGAAVYFDSGNIVIGPTVYSYDTETANPGNVTVQVFTGNPQVLSYFIEYTGPQLATLRSNYLRYIRLVPSYAQPELMVNFVGGFNRIFADFNDLVGELNNATVDDPLEGEPSNEYVGQFKFVPNQVAFSFNQRFNKIIFTGLNTLYSYIPAAADDPLWVQAAQELQVRDKQNTRFVFSGAIQIIQPYIPFRNLDLRLGFTYVIYPPAANFTNMIRPFPPFIQSPPVGLGDVFSNYDHVAPGYPDLVYSSCCYLYCDIIGGSTVDSLANKALLGSVPINTPNLGIGFHSLPLNNPLTKISNQVYEIYIEMRTDTGEPFYLPNSAIVSLELILTY